ncbi:MULTISPECIES: FAD-dependent oxidoreductase [Ramlibacter]|uniref:FAD-dependent oxidoreductase n=1 Tax=Ramlibacter pinisoli TaxID=2682844 RepID=A0A6N8IZU1_9BURK|nr:MULTISPECIES: FAD-dependent oxidoreductase [Ramlibacter]MBA2962173.1 FAD-dependent oxidoreductase [Ramlibacter sp. CGMCC 1.13660]MVQ32115.1 FAD-dependent oxidoreductase [Ramlibacter pinisoli]
MTGTQSLDADVAVVGAGLAGLVAALRCARGGRRVVVLEQASDERHVCNSRLASGVFHVAFCSPATAPEELERRMRERHPAADPRLIRTLAHNALRAARWLRDEAGAHFMRAGAEPLYDYVLAPPAVARSGRAWQGRGADVLLRALEATLQRHGGVVRRGHRAQALLQEQGRCTGAQCEGAEGALEVRSSTVVLADGGFQGDPDLLRRHVTPRPEALVQRNARTGRGDGWRMAQAAGAAMRESATFYGHVQSRSALDDDQLWPYPWLDELARSCIVVGADGRRIADEGRGGIHLANCIARLREPASTFVIADRPAWEGPAADRPTGPNPKLERAGGRILRAHSLAALAAEAGIDAQGLEREVAAYNTAVRSGEFGTLQPARSTGQFRAWPILTPPFYALPAAAGITYTFGGIAVDQHSRVLATSGVPLPGLYAVGSTAGGLEGGENVAYFGGLVKATVTALCAAEHILENT